MARNRPQRVSSRWPARSIRWSTSSGVLDRPAPRRLPSSSISRGRSANGSIGSKRSCAKPKDARKVKPPVAVKIRRGSTPEEQGSSRSAPGTEAFKQDRSRWESLRQNVDRALEEHDAAVSRQLAKTLGEDRLTVGGSERVPEQYRRLVAKYYESLARVKK